MNKKSSRKAAVRVAEAIQILTALGLPREQLNDRSALSLLALLDLTPGMSWSQATSPLIGITPMMEYFAKHYGKKYKPNSRETVRRFTVHQFLQAGLIEQNPDFPRPINSPDNVYQIHATLLTLLQGYGTKKWKLSLETYLKNHAGLVTRYAAARDMDKISITLPDGIALQLSSGGQNPLIRAVIEEFCPRYTPGGRVLYIGDAGNKNLHWDQNAMKALGIAVDEHGKMPDVVIHFAKENWLVLIEAVTSHGPVNAKRHFELKELFRNANVGLVFVTAFPDRNTMMKYFLKISYETEVWNADAPTHMIHINGKRFLGPY